MTPELQSALLAAQTLPVDDLPKLLGQLEEVRMVAVRRLLAATATPKKDELLDIDAASHRLAISKDFLYREADKFPFTVRISRRLLFSSNGIDAFIAMRNPNLRVKINKRIEPGGSDRIRR